VLSNPHNIICNINVISNISTKIAGRGLHAGRVTG